MHYIQFSSLFSLTYIRNQIYRKVLILFFIYLQIFQALKKNLRNNLINEFVVKKALIRDLSLFRKQHSLLLYSFIFNELSCEHICVADKKQTVIL